MGLIDKLFKKPKTVNAVAAKYFEMLDGYVPAFTTYEGGVYEMELTRACIHSYAQHCAKLQANVEGANDKRIASILEGKPNDFMTSYQFLYKIATILSVTNTCYIVPLLDKNDRIIGYYPINPVLTELVEYQGKPYLRYTFSNGKRAAIEFDRVGCLYNFNYHSDVRGDDNKALYPTMQLIDVQRQGINTGIKNSASYRFMATLGNFAKDEDVEKKRKKFTEDNFNKDNGGLLLFPNTFTNIQQIRSDANIVDVEQMKVIETRVFYYFGTNADILQNNFDSESWAAYYEGKIEPFAIQLSQALTAMTFTGLERSRNNKIIYSSNRLQYMSNTDKLNVSSQMFDRGVMSINQIMDVWNLPHVEDGDKRYIRKEYIEVSKLDEGDEETDKNPASAAPAEASPVIDNNNTGEEVVDNA